MLKQMTVSAYPHIKESKARLLHRKIHTQAYPDTHKALVGPEALKKFLEIQQAREQNG